VDLGWSRCTKVDIRICAHKCAYPRILAGYLPIRWVSGDKPRYWPIPRGLRVFPGRYFGGFQAADKPQVSRMGACGGACARTRGPIPAGNHDDSGCVRTHLHAGKRALWRPLDGTKAAVGSNAD
jgi:hypothetical protein